MTSIVKYKDLVDGDIVLFYGYDWVVNNIKHVIRDGVMCTYFTLTLTDKSADIYDTPYNGGQYGGISTRDILMYNRKENTTC